MHCLQAPQHLCWLPSVQSIQRRHPVQVCDETLGALAYMLKRGEQLPPGPIFTARLEVDYKKVGFS